MASIEEIIVDPPEEGAVGDPAVWFGSPGPFELEIGSGKGGFLLSRARARPDVRLLGVEWASKFFRFCADRIARWGLENVRVMRTDAKFLVLRQLPPECVSVLHLYHPDPWPKKRHHKRRLVQADFVEAAVEALVPAGRWLIQSDHQEYFEQMATMLGGHPALQSLTWEDGRCAVDPDWAGTNFEIKYTREGRPIYRAAFRLK